MTRGRLQYRYDQGLWDEWWVWFPDRDEHAWISQDEAEYMLEEPLPDARAGELPAFDTARPGDRVTLAGTPFWIEERGEATLAGIEGELPFAPELGERHAYVDLNDGARKATIEYFPDGSTHVFLGRYLAEDELDALDA